jgi:hypothetical protein
VRTASRNEGCCGALRTAAHFRREAPAPLLRHTRHQPTFDEPADAPPGALLAQSTAGIGLRGPATACLLGIRHVLVVTLKSWSVLMKRALPPTRARDERPPYSKGLLMASASATILGRGHSKWRGWWRGRSAQKSAHRFHQPRVARCGRRKFPVRSLGAAGSPMLDCPAGRDPRFSLRLRHRASEQCRIRSRFLNACGRVRTCGKGNRTGFVQGSADRRDSHRFSTIDARIAVVCNVQERGH